MTKVREALPWESGLGQKAFFITLSGPPAHDSPVEMTILLQGGLLVFLEIRIPVFKQNCHLDRSVA
jgi:hypothetical protein